MKKQTKEIAQGTHMWSVATGKESPIIRASRDAAKYISTLEGFKATHATDRGVLWLFDSLNNAKRARNMMTYMGIQCGNNICEFRMAEAGCLEFIGPKERTGMMDIPREGGYE